MDETFWIVQNHKQDAAKQIPPKDKYDRTGRIEENGWLKRGWSKCVNKLLEDNIKGGFEIVWVGKYFVCRGEGLMGILWSPVKHETFSKGFFLSLLYIRYSFLTAKIINFICIN